MLHFKKKPLSLPKKTAKLPFGMVLPSILLSLFLPAGFVQAADTTQGRSVVTGYTMSDYIGESQNLASNGSQWTVDPKTGYYYIDPTTGIQNTSKVNPKVRVYVGDNEAEGRRDKYKTNASVANAFVGSTMYVKDSVTGAELGDMVVFSANISAANDFRTRYEKAANGEIEGYHTYTYAKENETDPARKEIAIASWRAVYYALASHCEEWDASTAAKSVGTFPLAYTYQDFSKWKDAAFQNSHYAFRVAGAAGAYGLTGPTMEMNSTAWRGTCAYCGKEFKINVYASKNAVADLPSVTAGSFLFTAYPLTGHLEMGTYIAHTCVDISVNRYSVIYDANTNDPTLLGNTPETLYYYGEPLRTEGDLKIYEYEGKEVRSVGVISENGFTREGYEFTGWNTKEDGTGTNIASGADFQELFSAVKDSIANTDGTKITLYAMWKPTKSTLKVIPSQSYNGGAKYAGVTAYTTAGAYRAGALTSKQGDFQWTASDYTANAKALNGSITNPTGYRTTFSAAGTVTGTGVSGNVITASTYVSGMSLRNSDTTKAANGSMTESGSSYTYYFGPEKGETDIVTISFKQNPITLPNATSSDSSLMFVGWYEDSAYTKYVGGYGDSYMPWGNHTLYAKFAGVDISLETVYYYQDGNHTYGNSLRESNGKTVNYATGARYPYTLQASRYATGAVNLRFSTTAASVPTAYVAYINKTGATSLSDANWEVISASSVDAIDRTSLSLSDETPVSTWQTYAVKHSGYYNLTVSGAQGGSNGKYTGGKGGEVSATVFLAVGDTLSYKVGGSNGTNGGGSGTASGGGYSIIKSAQKGVLLVAGGGGGASDTANGGDGGVSSSDETATDTLLAKENEDDGDNGQTGTASGGGGGWQGGKVASGAETVAYELVEEYYSNRTSFSYSHQRSLNDDQVADYIYANSYGNELYFKKGPSTVWQEIDLTDIDKISISVTPATPDENDCFWYYVSPEDSVPATPGSDCGVYGLNGIQPSCYNPTCRNTWITYFPTLVHSGADKYGKTQTIDIDTAGLTGKHYFLFGTVDNANTAEDGIDSSAGTSDAKFKVSSICFWKLSEESADSPSEQYYGTDGEWDGFLCNDDQTFAAVSNPTKTTTTVSDTAGSKNQLVQTKSVIAKGDAVEKIQTEEALKTADDTVLSTTTTTTITLPGGGMNIHKLINYDDIDKIEVTISVSPFKDNKAHYFYVYTSASETLTTAEKKLIASSSSTRSSGAESLKTASASKDRFSEYDLPFDTDLTASVSTETTITYEVNGLVGNHYLFLGTKGGTNSPDYTITKIKIYSKKISNKLYGTYDAYYNAKTASNTITDYFYKDYETSDGTITPETYTDTISTTKVTGSISNVTHNITFDVKPGDKVSFRAFYSRTGDVSKCYSYMKDQDGNILLPEENLTALKNQYSTTGKRLQLTGMAPLVGGCIYTYSSDDKSGTSWLVPVDETHAYIYYTGYTSAPKDHAITRYDYELTDSGWTLTATNEKLYSSSADMFQNNPEHFVPLSTIYTGTYNFHRYSLHYTVNGQTSMAAQLERFYENAPLYKNMSYKIDGHYVQYREMIIPEGVTSVTICANNYHNSENQEYTQSLAIAFFRERGENSSGTAGNGSGYGGSNYISDVCFDTSDSAGVKTGDGTISIVPGSIGFSDTTTEDVDMIDVYAKDVTRPNAVDEDTVRLSYDSGTLSVDWDAVETGTETGDTSDYSYYVAAYQNPESGLVTPTNSSVVSAKIASEIAGYYYSTGSTSVGASYIRDSVEDYGSTSGALFTDNFTWENSYCGEDDLEFTKEPGIEITTTQPSGYLYIAPVDVAGNVGDTISVELKGLPVCKVTFDTNRLKYLLDYKQLTYSADYNPTGFAGSIPAAKENKSEVFYTCYFAKGNSALSSASSNGMWQSGSTKQYVKYGGNFPSVACTGTKLSGWNTKPDGSGTTVTMSNLASVIGEKDELTLYAIWKEELDVAVPKLSPDTDPVIENGSSGTEGYTITYGQDTTSGTIKKTGIILDSILASNGAIIPSYKGYTTTNLTDNIWTRGAVVSTAGQSKATGIWTLNQVLYTDTLSEKLASLTYYAGVQPLAGVNEVHKFSLSGFGKSYNYTTNGGTANLTDGFYNDNKQVLKVDYSTQGTFWVRGEEKSREYAEAGSNATVSGRQGYGSIKSGTEAMQVKIDKTPPYIEYYKVHQDRLENYDAEDMDTVMQEGLSTTFYVEATDYANSKYGSYLNKNDTAGIQGVNVYVYDEEDPSNGIVYPMNLMNVLENTKDGAVLAGEYSLTVDLYAAFRESGKIVYQIYAVDNAGNISSTLESLDGGEPVPEDPDVEGETGEERIYGKLVNFTLKTVIYNDTEDSEGNCVWNMAEGETYFRTGEIGHVEVWAIGYVPFVTLDFGAMGEEAKSEILTGMLPEKYNMGLAGEDSKWNRSIPWTKATEIPVTRFKYFDTETNTWKYANPGTSVYEELARNSEGIPYALHYKVSGWGDEGMSERMPPYYEMKKVDGKVKSDGTPEYEWELRSFEVSSKRDNAQASATSTYILWDKLSTEVHYRVTHETK